MKKIYLIIVFFLITFNAFSQQAPFITTWEFSESDLKIIIPTTGPGYNFTVDFGDGTIYQNWTSTAIHTYSAPGIYTVKISGAFPRFYIPEYSGNMRNSIKSVEQWGDIQWQTMERAFWNCPHLVVNATDAPDLSQVTDLIEMFVGATSFNQSINHWDVANITNMYALFSGATSFNQPLNDWDVSQVSNMQGLFNGATSFNQPLDNWNISIGPLLNGTFRGASSFNQPLNNWDVSQVIRFSGIFTNATSFNQPLDNWDLSHALVIDGMFAGASSFNQPLNMWNVSNVTLMSGAFSGAISFNQPLNDWDVSTATDMRNMFANTASFNQPLDNWDVSNVNKMDSMFQNAVFNQSINSWDVSNVIRMSEMFKGASSFNQPLNEWDVSNVAVMNGMFEQATSFDQPLNNWNVSSVGIMERLFSEAISFNQPLNDWDTSSVYTMFSMFNKATAFNGSLNDWNVANVTSMRFMFSEAASFNQPLNDWNVSNVRDMTNMFESAFAFNQPLDNWDISNVINARDMFRYATSFDQDISTWDFSNIIEFNYFLIATNMRTSYYDRFLGRLVNLGIRNKTIYAMPTEYCNVESKDELQFNLGCRIYDGGMAGCNTILGTALYDENNDGCDADDIGIDNFMVTINDGIKNFITFPTDGNYRYNVNGTDFTVSLTNYPGYFTVSPASATVSFTNSDTEEVDFCVTSNENIQDLNITIFPLQIPRPGFETYYKMIVSNMGTQMVSNASLSLVFDEEQQDFIVANPAPHATTENELTFEIINLQPLSVQSVLIKMKTAIPPIVEAGDYLSFTANVTPNANDFTPEDNTFVLNQLVINSYDPNDKQVLQGEEIYLEQADEYLHYLIRFQNTGTASAVNVRIVDKLHPKLNWNSIQPIDSSHPYHVEITDGNKVEFFFDDIDLPAEGDNEPDSHGYIAYKIKPKNNVQVGDVISGDADIYFDFNAPINTNTVSTEIIANLGTDDHMSLENQISIYPNPTDGVLNIHLTDGLTLEEVKLYNLQGRTIDILRENGQVLNIENLTSGIYFLKVVTNIGAVNQRIIKK